MCVTFYDNVIVHVCTGVLQDPTKILKMIYILYKDGNKVWVDVKYCAILFSWYDLLVLVSVKVKNNEIKNVFIIIINKIYQNISLLIKWKV